MPGGVSEAVALVRMLAEFGYSCIPCGSTADGASFVSRTAPFPAEEYARHLATRKPSKSGNYVSGGSWDNLACMVRGELGAAGTNRTLALWPPRRVCRSTLCR